MSAGSAALSASVTRSGGGPPSATSRSDLRGRVDSGVRPPGDGEVAPAPVDRVQRLAEHTLDGALAGLPRPAPEAGAVVLERQLQRLLTHGRAV